MAWFRREFCADDTYNTLCVVPIDGLPNFDNETQWCQNYYNSTICADIQDSALEKMETYSFFYYNLNAAIGLFLIILVSAVFPLVDDFNLPSGLINIPSALAHGQPSGGDDHETSPAEKSRESYSRVARPTHRGMPHLRFCPALLFVIHNEV